jgi:hypothetical protein
MMRMWAMRMRRTRKTKVSRGIEIYLTIRSHKPVKIAALRTNSESNMISSRI